MRTVIQRVRRAAVLVDGETVGAIEQGLLILVGVGPGDTEAEAKWLADKIAVMRIFADADDKFNLSLLDVGGGALVVSQFTLYADAVQGRRPSFVMAAPPQVAEPLITRFCEFLKAAGVRRVETGRFGARMLVEIFNDGPVTILLNREPIP
jgi:D-tyrosyl-tRNA(Tyr) deacylase